jgi:aldehyde:ferredoxin oxidoreductase
MEIGDRIHTTRQAFNVKHGIHPRDNLAAARSLGRPAQASGANSGRTISIEKLARDYWEQFGWNPGTGMPEPERLQQLGIETTKQEAGADQ